ncbi:G-protein coupled receptor 1-like [Strongylocentrotus purpuratus]|uniref:G-protein coupled receptors family 1 profile domain-containing protein n=1 Tax=Strongylocentrotus purpuratus TaxID=7668 RepID=A0A7M7GK90_STRPU|nr:G-protein coupled receptor 1-like [Strongylocentrotus purpuratus]
MVLVLGLPGNAVIIKAYAWKKRKTSTDILIIAQAIVDFVACVFCPVFIIRSAFPGLTTTSLCQAAALVNNATAFASLYLTTAISIDRYMAVCRPLRRRITVLLHPPPYSILDMAAIPPDAQLCTVKHSLKSSPDHVPILAYHVCLVHDSPPKLLDVHMWAA